MYVITTEFNDWNGANSKTRNNTDGKKNGGQNDREAVFLKE